jgi:hypothetical protein
VRLGSCEAGKMGSGEAMEFGLRPIGARPTPRRELGMRNGEGERMEQSA